jgi:hypothetical protein
LQRGWWPVCCAGAEVVDKWCHGPPLQGRPLGGLYLYTWVAAFALYAVGCTVVCVSHHLCAVVAFVYGTVHA